MTKSTGLCLNLTLGLSSLLEVNRDTIPNLALLIAALAYTLGGLCMKYAEGLTRLAAVTFGIVLLHP